jgi:prepilin-type N-terminal cleavage/methylation domain-containing protein
MKIQKAYRNGFTLVEIMIVVAIIGLLATIAIPNFMRARTKSQQNACINNLRQIDGAVQQWALENKAAATSTVTPTDIELYLGRGQKIDAVVCPAAGSPATNFLASYEITRVDTAPVCRIGGGYTLRHFLQ